MISAVKSGPISAQQKTKFAIYWPAVLVISAFVGLLIVWSVPDNHIPVWDSAGHLMRSYQCAEIFGEHHVSTTHKVLKLLTVSPFYTPLTYYLHGTLIALLGHASWIDAFPRIFWYSLSCISLYLLARDSSDDKPLATVAVALWCLYPGLYGVERAFALLDIPMTGMVFLSLWATVLWKRNKTWRNCCILGLILGLTTLTKQTAILFLIGPGLLITQQALKDKSKKTSLQLLMVVIITAALFAAWAVPNLTAFQSFVGSNQKEMGNTNPVSTFFHNLFEYVMATSILISVPGATLFAAALIFAKNKRCAAVIAISTVLSLLLLSVVDWIPQGRYMTPITGLTAIISASYLTELWRSHKRYKQTAVVCILIWSGWLFFTLSFSPWPVAISPILDSITGISMIRPTYGTDQVSEPYWPRPKLDWGHDWIIDTISQATGNSNVPVHLFSDTKELNINGLGYLAKLKRSKIAPITFRSWSMVGYDYSYTKQDLDRCKWFVVLSGSNQEAGREFKSTKAQDAYNLLIKTVTSDKSYELVDSKSLPDGSKLGIYRRKDWQSSV